MTMEREQLERLITRVLDGEASATEVAQLEALRSSDPAARVMYEETARLDALLGTSLRDAIEPSGPQTIPFPRRSDRVMRYWVGAVAAAIAAFAWFQPTPIQSRENPAPLQAGMHTPHILGDVIEPVPSSYETPELRIRGTEREWILIPADQPGLYWVIEADRERTQVVPLSSDL